MTAFGIIPTNGRECVDVAIARLLPQVERIFIVEGGPNRTDRDYPDRVTVLSDLAMDCNVSRWWNIGLEAIEQMTEHGDQYDIAIINDDVLVPDGWFNCVAWHIRHYGAAAGCSGGLREGQAALHKKPGAVDLHTRMQGFAFVLAGEKGIRANEAFTWYYSDDHVDWIARQLGGMIMIPGCHVQHLYPNGQVSGEIQVQIVRDTEAFKEYWGMMPW